MTDAPVSHHTSEGPTALASSFRDPAGFVFERDGVLYRQVSPSFAEHYDLLRSSGLHDTLVREGLLVPAEEVDPSIGRAAYRVLRPERVAFISYPYEWCPGQLRDAALATLRIHEIALDHGMSLRDASAYNIQFHRGRPTLIDTLSFERYEPGHPWVAYKQFCQHFLAPLALETQVHVRYGRLLRGDVDGIDLGAAAAALPFRTRLRPGLLTHLHLHARSLRHGDAAGDPGEAPPRTAFSERAMRGLVQSLRSAVDGLEWDPPRSTWSDYYAEADHYTDVAMRHKLEIVARLLDEARPSTVWDLGANTGRFARLATERGATAVAWDVDEAAVEANWREVRRSGETDLLPLVLDLANPSPRIGWANQERMSVGDRGPVDTVLALALVHHLAIGNNVPLPMIAAFLADLCRHLIIEFVPKDDPKVRTLLRARQDVFTDYTVEGFERAFGERFTVDRRESLEDSSRTIYLMSAR